MERNVAQLALFERLWAWFETNKQQALAGTAIVVVVGVAVSYYVWSQGEKEASASEELSTVMSPLVIQGGDKNETAAAYLKIAAEHPGTDAARRALLQAASVLFTQGKYAEAQAQFEKFVRENSESPFRSEAQLGVAACLDALGKTNDAVRAYKDLVDRLPNDNVAPQAKFALARIYESQNRLPEAYDLFEQTARANPRSSIGSEAGMRAEELKMKLPPPAPAPMPEALTRTPSNLPPVKATNAP